MIRAIALSAALTMPAVAFAQDGVPLQAYAGAYSLQCVEADFAIDVFASAGTLGLAADSAFLLQLPVSCDGISEDELLAFTRESVLGCTEELGDATVCQDLVRDISAAVADFNAVLEDRMPLGMNTRVIDTQDGPEILRARHVWPSGVKRAWEYELNGQTGEIRASGLGMPALDVTMLEAAGFDCDTFLTTAGVTGHLSAEGRSLNAGLSAEPAAVCTLEDPDAERPHVVELYGHFHAAIEGDRLQRR